MTAEDPKFVQGIGMGGETAAEGQRIQILNLQKLQSKPITVKYREDEGRWIAYDEYRLIHPNEPYFTRQILQCEIVFDFDMVDYSDNVFNAKKLVKILNANNIPHWIGYSGGKGFHVHVFFDRASIIISDVIVNDARKNALDIEKTIRNALWLKLMKWAEIDQKDAKLDSKKVNFRSDKKGSMLRDFGTPRIKDSKTYYKTLIKEIPDIKPNYDSLPLVFPGAPQLWNVSHLSSDIETVLKAKIKQYRNSGMSNVNLSGVEIYEVYCINKLIKNGVDRTTYPVYYGSYSIARCCHDLGLAKTIAEQLVKEYLDKCSLTIDEYNTRFDNSLNGYESDTHRLSCESIKENYGDEFCNKNCSIFQKRLEQKQLLKKNKRISNELDTALGEFTGILPMAKKMQERTPIFYDRAKLYWKWFEDVKFYRMVDETDIILAIHRLTKLQGIIESKFKNEVLTAIQMTGRALEIEEPPKHWIQFKNTVYDIQSKKGIDATPKYLFTSPIPHTISHSTDTPTIDKLFESWVGADKKQLLYEICAYCFVDDYPIHRILCFVGRGRNGKGQFFLFLEKLIGFLNCTSATLEKLIHSRFEAAKLYKKKICFIGETNFNTLKDTALLKSLSGNDIITAEFKNKNPFDFRNTAKIIITGNSLPATEDKTDGFYSRWIIVDFFNQFDQGKDIIDTIPDSEYDNMVSKCLSILPGLLELGKFTGEGTIEHRAKMYEEKSDPVSKFIEMYCEKNAEKYEATWKLYEKFSEFQAKKGYRLLTQREFNKALKNAGYEVEKKNISGNNWVWVFGFALKKTTEQSKNEQPKITQITRITQSTNQSLIENLSEISGKTGNSGKIDNGESTEFLPKISDKAISGNSVTELIEQAGREWEQVNGTAINSSNSVAFCLWYCEQKDKSKQPSEVKEIAKRIFKITPDKPAHLSYLCKQNRHKDCGGHGCDCDCHKVGMT